MNKLSQHLAELTQRVSDQHASIGEINQQVLQVLADLYRAYPDKLPVERLNLNWRNPELGEAILNWLSSLPIIKIDEGCVALTLTGQRSLHQAAAVNPGLKRLLHSGELRPLDQQPAEWVLEILELHFHDYELKRTT